MRRSPSARPSLTSVSAAFANCVDKGSERTHAERYKRSFGFLVHHHALLLQTIAATTSSPLDVLSLGGGKGIFENCLGRVVPITLHTYDGDLSYPYCALTNRSADLVLSLEVIEHLKDQATAGISAHWQGSGVFTHLREIRRVLRPAGRALISTPNVASYDAMARLLQGRGPQLFGPHVRELSKAELEELMQQAGLTADRVLKTVDTYPHSRAEREPLERLAARTHRARDHNQTIIAIAGPATRDGEALGDGLPPVDRLLRLWRKRIAIKLPGADVLVRNGCPPERSETQAT